MNEPIEHSEARPHPPLDDAGCLYHTGLESAEPEETAPAAVITGISHPPHDPNRCHLRVDGRRVATLPASVVDALSIAVGQPWTPCLRDALRRAAAVARARAAALRLLGARALSTGELRERLARRDHADSVIVAVIEDLRASGWLDDETFARGLAEELLRRQPAAASFIEAKLMARHVDEETARRVAHAVLDAEEGDPVEHALALAVSRRRAMGAVPPRAARRRIAQALARRGFDQETIEQVLDRLPSGAPDGQDPL